MIQEKGVCLLEKNALLDVDEYNCNGIKWKLIFLVFVEEK